MTVFIVCSITKSTTFSLHKVLFSRKHICSGVKGFRNILVVSLLSPTNYSRFKFTVNERESEIILGNRK